MRTIPDSNVILDLLDEQSPFHDWSTKWFETSALADAVVTNAVVFAEASSRFPDLQAARAIFEELAFVYENILPEAAHHAGRAHRIYRQNGGRRDRVLPDFLIGAHAANNGYRILTRDGSRYRTYFPDVEVIAPDTHP
jgi:predicted nucleic acid-binding protein